MANVRNPKPRVMDEREYYRQVYSGILDPLQRSIVDRINQGISARKWLDVVMLEFDNYIDDHPDLGEDEATAMLGRLNAYQRAEMVVRYSRAFGANVSPLLPDSVMAPTLKARLRANVDLIKSLPSQYQAQVQEQFYKVFSEHGLDQQKLNQMLTERFNVAKNRAKLITRDQNNKIIGELNAERNKQLGIERYTWVTAGDERVRSSHSLLNGTRQRWDSPPSVGHPGYDIQCRCISLSEV